jgi:hypothetical protein
MIENEARGSQGTSWLLVLSVVLYGFFKWLGVYLGDVFPFPPDSPGSRLPWYFIRRDAFDGLALLPYLALSLVVGVIAIRKKVPGGGMFLWFGLIWSAAPLWQLALIYWKSDHIFDPVSARTSWPDAPSYLGDPLRWGWFVLFLVAVLFQAGFTIRSRWKSGGL